MEVYIKISKITNDFNDECYRVNAEWSKTNR